MQELKSNIEVSICLDDLKGLLPQCKIDSISADKYRDMKRYVKWYLDSRMDEALLEMVDYLGLDH